MLQRLPITAKLNPLAGGRNLVYLAEAAVLTRLATGMTRVWQNKPEKLDDTKLTPTQKRQAFWERFFVEILGTSGYIACLHLGQDLTSKFFERRIKKLPELPKNNPELNKVFTQLEIDQINEAQRKVFGPRKAGESIGQRLISRVLYGEEVNGGKTLHKASLKEFEKLLEAQSAELVEKFRAHADGKQALAPLKEIMTFVGRLNRKASFTVMGGVALSALFGGLITQWMNDWVVAPALKKFLSKHSGAEAEQNGKQQGAGLHVHNYRPPASPGMQPMPGSLAQARAGGPPSAKDSFYGGTSPPQSPAMQPQTEPVQPVAAPFAPTQAAPAAFETASVPGGFR